MAQVREEREELASVVVAAAAEERPSEPWHVTLRPWLFCLMFLCLFELGARVWFDHTLCLRQQRFDNFANAAAEDVWVDQIRRDDAFRIVMIGDSVVVGPKLLKRDQTIPRYLEAILQERMPGRPIHVWNFSLPGTRSTDQLCLVRKALPARPDMVVLSGNYITFSQDVSQLPLLHPWLLANLPNPPESLRPFMPKPKDYKEAANGWFTNLFEKGLRIVGMRQAINAMLFGEQPRVPFDDPNPFVMAGVETAKRVGVLKPRAWNDPSIKPGDWRGKYERRIGADDFNGRFYPEILADLNRAGVPALTYLTAQNPMLLAEYLPRDVYLQQRQVMAGFFRDSRIPFHDFSDAVPGNLFVDNDHMLPAGNRILAERLADQIEPIIRPLLQSRSR